MTTKEAEQPIKRVFYHTEVLSPGSYGDFIARHPTDSEPIAGYTDLLDQHHGLVVSLLPPGRDLHSDPLRPGEFEQLYAQAIADGRIPSPETAQ